MTDKEMLEQSLAEVTQQLAMANFRIRSLEGHVQKFAPRHLGHCNNWISNIGGPGCICAIVSKQDAAQLETIRERQKEAKPLTFWEFTKKCVFETTLEFIDQFKGKFKKEIHK
jgi:hypothetical protein